MKKNIILFSLGLSSAVLFSQTGNVGIGTENPSATLHLKTNNQYILRIEDAVDTSTSFYTIQSSDDKGTFKKVPTDVFRKVQILMLPNIGQTVVVTSPNWGITPISITVAPGKWQITGSLVLRPSASIGANGVLKCRMSVADTSSSTIPSSDIIADTTTGNGFFEGSYYSPSTHEIMKGNIYINNSSGGNKTYYFIANIERINATSINFSNFGSSTEPENQIFAIPIY